MKIFSFVLLFLFFSNVKAQNLGNGISDIDGNSYKTIIIGDQEWMGENLKTSKYNDGSSIPNVTDSASWVSLATGAWVHYNNDEKFNSIYGKLYNGFVIRKDKNVCPSGWHIPKANDFEDLVNFLGGDTIAGEKLKELDTTLWYSPYEASNLINSITTLPTNTSSFSGRPGGVVNERWGFGGMRWGGFWWGETAEDSTSASFLLLIHYTKSVTLSGGHAGKSKKNGFSIRCLKDPLEGSIDVFDCQNKVIKGVLIDQNETKNVTIEIPYFGGNGVECKRETINSTGVLGLTAILESSRLKQGDSTLIYKISGTPTSDGTAHFEINFSGKNCSIDLPVLCRNHKVDSITACDPYQWHDSTYTTSGTYIFTYTNVNGCTSKDTLVLLYPKQLDLVVSGDSVIHVGDSIQWATNQSGTWFVNGSNNVSIDTKGTIIGINEGTTQIIFNAALAYGCTQTIRKNIYVLPAINPCDTVQNKIDSLTSCYSYKWHNQTYTKSGLYSYNYKNLAGCNLTDTLYLTIIPLKVKWDTIKSCSSIVWNNKTYSTSGEYSYTYKNEAGCSETDMLHLMIFPSQNKIDSITACDPYQWHDSIYSASGTYTFNYVNTNGCSLTDTLVLLYSQPLDLDITGDSVVNVGDSIRWTSNLSGTWGLNSDYHVKIDSLGWIKGLNEGEAEVTLYVYSDLGCVTSLMKKLKVLPGENLCKNFYAVISNFEDTKKDSAVCNGKVNIEQKGGKLPVSYLWNTGETVSKRENLCAGEYLVTLTDANLCTVVLKTAVSEVSTQIQQLDVEVTSKNASILQSCDGSVSVVVKNGTPPYLFDAVERSNYERDSICPGLYTLVVKDANNVETKIYYVIYHPENSIQTINEILKDSSAIDTLKTTLLNNCDIDLNTIDSVKIKEYIALNNSFILVTWGLYSKNKTQFVTQKYKLDKGTGVYTALLEMYCKEDKRKVSALSVSEKLYYKSTENSTAGVTNLESQNQLKVYPNPFSDEVEIELDNAQDFHLEIIGVNGQLVFEEEYINRKSVHLNLGYLTNGVYTVKVTNGKFVQNRLIVK